jgi:uncharacterized protein
MRTVTVTGRGTAREVPDTVVVRVASSHRATGVAEALAGADSAATEIIAVGREHTEASRIGSTNLNVWPAYDNEGKASGFEARHSLSITCTDIASAGDLLAALATKVGDRLQVEGFGLEVSDTARALDSARPDAYADAVARAGHLAELAGAHLGEVQAMVEGGVSGPVGGAEGAMARDMMKPVAIEPGETTIAATVTVTFELS